MGVNKYGSQFGVVLLRWRNYIYNLRLELERRHHNVRNLRPFTVTLKLTERSNETENGQPANGTSLNCDLEGDKKCM